MIAIRAVCAFLTAALTLAACSCADANLAPPEGCAVSRDIRYGSASSKQALDIVFPIAHTHPRPAVIYIHGGGWSGGDKSDDPEMQMGMYKGFVADGFVAVAINYRLDDEAKFPAPVEDCKLAVRWLREHAADYGIDATRIGVVGGSAGGHLANMLAVTRREDGFDGPGIDTQPSDVQAVASVSGPTDLQVPMCASQVESRREMVAGFLGVPEDRIPAAAKKASPITYARKETPPILLVHCKDDKSIDADQSLRFAEALKKVGAPVEMKLLDGANHGSDMARTEPVLSMLRAFFRATLKP